MLFDPEKKITAKADYAELFLLGRWPKVFFVKPFQLRREINTICQTATVIAH